MRLRINEEIEDWSVIDNNDVKIKNSRVVDRSKINDIKRNESINSVNMLNFITKNIKIIIILYSK